MKTKNILLIAAMGLLMSGCFIKSLYPFYTKKEIVSDARILGTWLDDQSNKWVIYQQMRGLIPADSSYQIEIKDKDGNSGSFNTHLFRLNNQFYLDFYPSDGQISSNDFIKGSILFTHTLAKIEFSSNGIKIQWFNENWLAKLLEQNKIRIRHEELKDGLLLTASTEDLQKFIVKYGNDSQAFKLEVDNDKKKNNDKDDLTYILKKISNEAK
jgi:hypothetical protein